MAIAIADKRLLEGLKEAAQRARAIELTGAYATWRDQAAALLERGHQALETQVKIEDREDTEAEAAQDDINEERSQLNEAFRRAYSALHAGLYRRGATGDDDRAAEDLSAFLERSSPSQFAAQTLAMALQGLERTRTYSDRFIPSDLQPNVNAFIDGALARTREAQARLRQANTEAKDAFENLEEARVYAQNHYLAARSILDAALRLGGDRERLDEIAPSLQKVTKPVSRSTSSASNAASTPVSAEA